MTTAAEEFGKYVDAVIPLGFRIADETTKLKEFAIYMAFAAEAQSRLSAATDAVVAFARLMPLVVSEEGLRDSAGGVDSSALLTQLYVSSQLLYLRREAEAAVEASARIVAGLATADHHSFDHYSVDSLRVQVEKIHVELMDGVYLLGIDLVSLGISLAFSVLQVFSNAKEQAEIEGHNARLSRDSVKDADMRRYALKHSTDFKVMFTESFDAYQRLADGFQVWLGTHTPAQLEARHGRLLALVAQLERQLLDELESSAVTAVRKAQGVQDESEERLKLSVRANLRIAQNLVALDHAECGEFWTVAGRLESDLRLAELMALDSVSKRELEVRQAVRTKRLSCLNSGAQKPLRALTLNGSQANGLGFCVYAGGYAFGTFCENLHATSGPPGVSTNSQGGYCQNSPTLSYSVCGGSLPTGDGWDGVRAVVAAQGGLPGAYSARRGQVASSKLETSLLYISQHATDLSEIGNHLVVDSAVYRKNIVVPSVDATRHALDQATADVSNMLLPALAGGVTAPIVPGVPWGTIFEVASTSIREREVRIGGYEGAPIGLWNLLAPIQFVGAVAAQHLAVPDRRALLAQYRKYFGEDGVARAGVLATQFAVAGRELAALYRTGADSFEGAAFRAELNRGLFALSGPLSAQSKLAVAGALAMVSAADMAIAVGDRPSGERLAAIAAGTIDFALGLTPAAPLNDATQILSGVLTGKDYAGNPMAASDYALRAMGVVIGAIPLARPALSLGGTLVTEAVVHGAELVKRMNARGSLMEMASQTRLLLRSFTEFIGETLDRALIQTMSPQDVAAKIQRILVFEGHLLASESRQWLLGTWDKLRLEGKAFDEGLVKRFDVRPFSRVDVPSDGRYARVVPRDVARDILAGSAPLSRNPHGEAFITAASDLGGLATSEQIARRLALFTDESGETLARLEDHVVLEFRLAREPLVSPVNFDLPYLRDAGWIYGGLTQGGAREWIIDARASTQKLLEFLGEPRRIDP